MRLPRPLISIADAEQHIHTLLPTLRTNYGDTSLPADSVLISCHIVLYRAVPNYHEYYFIIFIVPCRVVPCQKLEMTGTTRLRHDVPNRAVYNRVSV
jgi:hypothetical protein